MIGLTVLNLLIPLCYLLVGDILEKHHSKFPDTFAGYHIGKLAPKNNDTWETANTYAGTVLMRTSLIALCVSIILSVIAFLSTAIETWLLFAYLLCIGFIPVILLGVLTEKHLKKLFFKDGYRRK